MKRDEKFEIILLDVSFLLAASSQHYLWSSSGSVCGVVLIALQRVIRRN